MSAASVTCPFCNAAVPVGDPPPPRAICPRCGEGFKPPAEASGGHQPPVDIQPPTPRATQQKSAAPRLVLLAGAVALLAVVVVVLTRREPPPPTAADSRPPTTVPPAALAGLTYLPPTTNVIVAVQPAALVAHAERTGTDPKAVLAGVGLPDRVTAALDQFGLPLASIDQLVIGLALTNEAVPGVVGVLKLRTPPADEDALFKRLRAEKRPVAGRPSYSVKLDGLPLPLLLTKTDPLTYLFVFKDADLAMADRPHPPGGGHLPGDLQESLKTRLDPASFVWLATDTDRWHEKGPVKLFLKPDRLATLAKGRAAVAGLALTPNPTLRLAVRAADAPTADAVRTAVRQRLGEPATVGGESDWATAETPFDPNAGGLKALLADVGF